MLDKKFTATPAAQQRDASWAARVRSQTANPEWLNGQKTEGFIIDEDSNDWYLRSGTDHKTELTERVKNYLEECIRRNIIELGNEKVRPINRSKLLESKTHLETKAAAWMRLHDKKELDVVINRNYVCGLNFDPQIQGDNGKTLPGCYQATSTILYQDQVMRVWILGQETPLIIRGTQKRKLKS